MSLFLKTSAASSMKPGNVTGLYSKEGLADVISFRPCDRIIPVGTTESEGSLSLKKDKRVRTKILCADRSREGVRWVGDKEARNRGSL